MIHGLAILPVADRTILAYCSCGQWHIDISTTRLAELEWWRPECPVWLEIEHQFNKHLREAMSIQMVPVLGDAS